MSLVGEDIETVAKRLFEADPHSDMEADWENLADYKKENWRFCARTSVERGASS